MRRCPLTCLFGLSFVLLLACPVAPSRAQQPSTIDASNSSLHQAIEKLGSDSFSQREAAMSQLIKSGTDCLPFVIDMLDETDPETRYRAATVIRVLAYSDDDLIRSKTRQTLEKLEGTVDLRAANIAKSILREFLDDAIRQLQSLRASIQMAGGEVRVIKLKSSKLVDQALPLICLVRPLELELRSSQVTDEHLKLLSKQTQLQRLNLRHTQVTDEGMQYLAGLRNLKTFSIENTAVTDAGLVHFKALHQLTKVFMGGSQIKGPGLEHLQDLPITYLSFQHSKVDDSVVPYVAKLKQLETLGFDDTQVTNAGIRPLADLKELRTLWINNSRVNARSLPDLKRLKQLDSLHVQGVGLTEGQRKELQEAIPELDISK